MQIVANFPSVIVNPIEYAGKAIKEVVVVASVFITSVDGLYYISELALSVFALADRLIEHAPKALHRSIQIMRGNPAIHNTIGMFRGYMDLTCVLDIINRGRDWMTPDENGNYIWDRDFPTIAYYISLTISDIANHLYLIDKFKYIQLGTWAGPVNLIYGTATISQQVFDIWTTFHELEKAIYQYEVSKVRLLQWQIAALSTPEEIQNMIEEKANKWAERVQYDQSEKAIYKRNKWHTWSLNSDPDELSNLANNMVRRKAVEEKNWSIKVLTSYCSLVCTISYLALLLLSALSVVIIMKELMLAVAVLTVIVNALYVGDFIIEHYFKPVTKPDHYIPYVV